MSVLTRIEGVAPHSTQLPVGLATGANVRTPCGPRRVENLRPGDLVVTRKDGLQPIRMIWRRTIAATEVAADPSLAPVVIAPRAIGPMMPQAELRIAASHRILLPGYRVEGMRDHDVCMIRARDFAAVSEHAWIDRGNREVSYYNLVFDRHQTFAANGLPVESFLPTPVSVSTLADEEIEALAAVVPGISDGSGINYPPLNVPVWDETASITA